MELTELHEIKLMQLNVPFTSEGHDKDVLSIIVYVGGDNADIISLHQIRAEATDTAFCTSVKAEHWQYMNIEPAAHLLLFIGVDHKKLQFRMHASQLTYLLGHYAKRV